MEWSDYTVHKKAESHSQLVAPPPLKFVEREMNSFLFGWQGAGLYSRSIKKVEDDIQGALKKVNELTGKHEPFYSNNHS